jgi:ribonuclease HI
MFGWARNDWLKSDNKPPENLDLIKAYYNFLEIGYQIDLRKIKGHNGHEWNELADQLATGSLCSEYVERKYNGK